MTDLIYTRHARTRMQQRGIRKADIPIILAYGTQIDDETYFMCNRDAAREIETRKREIQTLSRLVNRKVVIRDGRVITAYPSNPSDQKRTLRRGREKGFGEMTTKAHSNYLSENGTTYIASVLERIGLWLMATVRRTLSPILLSEEELHAFIAGR